MNFLVNAAATARAARFKARDPFRCQREIFRNLISRGTGTRFGRDHGFGDLAIIPFETAYRRYRESVPIRTYADFWKDYFAVGFRKDGDQLRLQLDNVTWPGRIPLYCETSGTTAPTKFIPFTREMFAENRRAALDLTACYLAGNQSSRLMGGKLLYMAGATELKDVGNGARSGDMSAITLRNRPEVVIVDEGMIYTWSREVRGRLGGQSKIPHIDPTPDGEMVHAIVTYAAR